MVSHPETGSDPPIGLDRESGVTSWLDLFLFEKEGCWLGFGDNSRFSVFHAHIYGYLCSISLNLGLNLLSTPSLTCIWQAFWL